MNLICHSERSEESSMMRVCDRAAGFFAALLMNVWVVILRLGEESSTMLACRRATGFFAKPANEHPLFVILNEVKNPTGCPAVDRATGFFAEPQNDRTGIVHRLDTIQRLGAGCCSQNDKQGKVHRMNPPNGSAVVQRLRMTESGLFAASEHGVRNRA